MSAPLILTLTVPGERIALEVMRHTLRQIAMESEPWSGSPTTSAEMAQEALRVVEALEGMGGPV